jgi:hypothetical protein
MNTPLVIFNNILPQEVLDQIQQYLPVNEKIRTALANYYDKLYEKKVMDDEEAFEIYIYPVCLCANCPDNGRNKVFIRRECAACFEHEMKEYLGEYTNERFHLVCKNNPQYRKIAYKEYDYTSDDSSVDDMYWYDDREIWLE